MLYLYLDESGDLGFDFFAKKPSKYFTVTVLAVTGTQNNRKLINGAKKTVKRKLHGAKRELKGAKTSLELKEYFYRQVSDIAFKIYSLTLNKQRVYENLARQKDRVYNFIAGNVLAAIPLNVASTRVEPNSDIENPDLDYKGFSSVIPSLSLS